MLPSGGYMMKFERGSLWRLLVPCYQANVMLGGRSIIISNVTVVVVGRRVTSVTCQHQINIPP